jgi:hypothetical protein
MKLIHNSIVLLGRNFFRGILSSVVRRGALVISGLGWVKMIVKLSCAQLTVLELFEIDDGLFLTITDIISNRPV